MRTLAALTLVLFAACDSRQLNKSDLSDADAAAQDQSTSGCMKIDLGSSPMVTPKISYAAAPAATGGKITDGTYWLTADTFFVADMDMAVPTPMLRGVIELDGAEYAASTELLGATTPDSGTFTVSGNQIMLTSCVDQSVGTKSFTATTTTFTLFETSLDGLVGMSVYTKQ